MSLGAVVLQTSATDGLAIVVIGLMGTAIATLFGVVIHQFRQRISSLEAALVEEKNTTKKYEDGAANALAAYQEREREEAAWRREKQDVERRRLEEEAWRRQGPSREPHRGGGDV